MGDCAVLIVGRGPVGRSFGIALARAGVRAVLVEDRTAPTPHPKATLLGARSMEHFRAWDRLALKVADAAMQQEADYFILFCDRLAGHESHRIRACGLAAMRRRALDAVARFRIVPTGGVGMNTGIAARVRGKENTA